MQTKTCTKCNVQKPITEFGNDKSKSDGKQPSCKNCKSQTDKAYKSTNRDKVKENDKRYYEQNSEAIKARVKQWYQANKEHHLARSKLWRKNNYDKWVSGKKRWLEANKDKMKKYINDYIKEKYQNDMQYRIKSICASRIRSLVRNDASTFDLIGCNYDFFHDWIEYQFDENMTWENIGQYWHFDHVVPCSSYDLSNKDELEECFHWSNMRPLEAQQNLKKHDKVLPDVINQHATTVERFLRDK